ncbi:MAG: lysoplasmalogenase family protein [Dermatophilaceae bacterium]
MPDELPRSFGAALLLPVGVRIIGAAAGVDRGRGGAVTAYIVISAMAILGWATGRPLLGLGVSAFAVSDTILGFNRFVRPLAWGPVAVMVTHLVAQAPLVAGTTSLP